MKKYLISIAFMGLAVLASTQALAGEGCRSLALDLVRAGTLDNQKMSKFVETCTSKTQQWADQCKAEFSGDFGLVHGTTPEANAIRGYHKTGCTMGAGLIRNY
jgi:hypothetical protein